MYLSLATRKLMTSFLVAIVLTVTAYAADPNPPSIHSDEGAWPIRRQWTVAETQHFAEWINNIYKYKTKGTVEQRRAKLVRVLTDPEMNLLLNPEFAGEQANPQLPEELMWAMHNIVDCAKLTVSLSSYYSYRRALPWMFSYVRSGGGDLRTAHNNTPIAELNCFTSDTLDYFFRNAVIGFCTGNYRVEPFGENAQESDTVPVAINKQFLIPGAMHYLDGHVLVLADIEKDGELRFLDSTTAASRDIYSFNGLNSVTGIPPKRSNRGGDPYAGCFQGLRIFRYPIAEVDENGKVTKVRRRTDKEMAEFGFSVEQYDKVEEIVTTQHIVENGFKLDSFHEFIMERMRTADSVVPTDFLEHYADELLDLYKMREISVQEAWANVLASGAITYPENDRAENIFTAGGRWGQFSTASSDVEIRNRYYYLADWMDNVIRWYNRRPGFIDTKGLEKYYVEDRGNLARALVGEKYRIFKTKTMEYTNSAGEKVTLSLLDIEKRLYDLSFDPNHAPELRWGAPIGSAEFASAKPIDTPLPSGGVVVFADAFKKQAYYRAVCARETTESYLSNMFTSGFPVRDKYDGQLMKWIRSAPPVPPLISLAPMKQPEPKAEPVKAALNLSKNN
ncbi:MAG: hypothetical protein IT366_09875 [Candidatus Hydrogenedentes bacterium]|nr:hypothetical protein [Candidatus Hydrogenedentota bacterium]